MSLYSEKDLFARGVWLLLCIPIFLPHFALEQTNKVVSVLVLVTFFVIAAALYGQKLWSLLHTGKEAKIYVSSVLTLIIINTICSIYTYENRPIIYLLIAMSTVVAIFGGRISGKNHQET